VKKVRAAAVHRKTAVDPELIKLQLLLGYLTKLPFDRVTPLQLLPHRQMLPPQPPSSLLLPPELVFTDKKYFMNILIF
jgi:hypothetical protein